MTWAGWGGWPTPSSAAASSGRADRGDLLDQVLDRIFGATSGQALSGVVGPLIEIPAAPTPVADPCPHPARPSPGKS
ncbi:hypothetical protein [Streptomyces sp. NPDC001876]|uniref:hypothetical protein n=1 Tax=Streptomyces sp. NPDC001876 TaxID=3154402 RepID=UPI00331F047F